MSKKKVTVFDITGFEKIQRGRKSNSSNYNEQRKLLTLFFNFLINKGLSPEEAAKDIGYSVSTFYVWRKWFNL